MDKIDLMRLECEATISNLLCDRAYLPIKRQRFLSLAAAPSFDLPDSASHIYGIRRTDTGLYCQLRRPESDNDLRDIRPLSDIPVDILVKLTDYLESVYR